MTKMIEVSDRFYDLLTDLDYACKKHDTVDRCNVLMAHYKWYRGDPE